jgi:hypothetical protein
MSIALVAAARALPRFLAHFKQLLFGFLNAPAALRRHLTEEIIRQASIRDVATAGTRRAEEAALIIRPFPLAVGLARNTVGDKVDELLSLVRRARELKAQIDQF